MNQSFYSIDGLRLRYLEWGETGSENVRRVQAPTLVIRAGAEPQLVSEQTAERLIRENPRIEVVTVSQAGHNIHFAHFDDFMTHLGHALSQPVGAAA